MERWIVKYIEEEMRSFEEKNPSFFGSISFRFNYQKGEIRNINVMMEKSYLGPEKEKKSK